MIIFETERLVVRQYEFVSDHENFFCLGGDPEVMKYIRPVKTKEQNDSFLREIIESASMNPLMGRWAVDEKPSGKFAGSFAFIPVEGTSNFQLGYSLLKENWGKGFATELLKEGINHVFTKTDLPEIYAISETANTASQKVIVKAGFIFQKIYMEGEKELAQYLLLKTPINT